MFFYLVISFLKVVSNTVVIKDCQINFMLSGYMKQSFLKKILSEKLNN